MGSTAPDEKSCKRWRQLEQSRAKRAAQDYRRTHLLCELLVELQRVPLHRHKLPLVLVVNVSVLVVFVAVVGLFTWCVVLALPIFKSDPGIQVVCRAATMS